MNDKDKINSDLMELSHDLLEPLNYQYEKLANILKSKSDIFFLGRLVDYAICLEGSLKLKEISYIHSEAYAAGELKHGTISLIEEGTPVIAVVSDERVYEKTISNIKEVKSRGAYVILLISSNIEVSDDIYDEKIIVKNRSMFTEPIIIMVYLQLLSYYVALERGCDIDKPKNLAKSVTVE